VLVSAAARFAVARTFDIPWIAPDEMIYGLVGESLWETGELSVRGTGLAYYSLLTPALIGLPLTFDDLRLGLAVAQALQALAMSLVAVPVYMWGRPLAGRGWALAAAAMAVLPPVLWYGGLLMTEALSYTLVIAALLACARMLEKPTALRQGAFLLFLSAAAAVRLQALVLLPALVLAVALHAWFGRSAATARRLLSLLALIGIAGAVTVALYGGDRGDLLGAYGALGETTPSSAGVLLQMLWHVGALAIMTIGLPLLATATLVTNAARRAEPDPALRAFLAVTAAYVALLVLQASSFAAEHLDHVSGRYLLTALPPLLLGLAVWVARGAPRPTVVAALLAAVATAVVVALPTDRFASRLGAHDALMVLPFVDLPDWNRLALRAGLLAFALVVAVAFLALPRRAFVPAVAAVALALVLLSALAAREIDRLSAAETARTFGPADPRWVDDIGESSTLLVDTGEQPSTSIARIAFWNRSIRRLVRLSIVPSQALPESVVEIERDGQLSTARGERVSAPRVVVPATIVPAGVQLATSPPTEVAPGYGLWRVHEPLRLVSRVEGVSPVGDFARARIVVYRCGAGQLELTLLGKAGLPIRIRVNGFPWTTVRPPPGESWTGSIEPLFFADGRSPCVFELESDGLVGSTRLEWVPG